MSIKATSRHVPTALTTPAERTESFSHVFTRMEKT